MKGITIKRLVRFFCILQTITICSISIAQNSQNHVGCRASEMMNLHYQAHPEAVGERDVLQQRTEQMNNQTLSESSGKKQTGSAIEKSGATYTIPVVFHVYGTTQNGTTITLALIQNALAELNKDFNGLNSDFNSVHNTFLSSRGTLSIEFALAQLDPNGNPTTGVEFLPVANGYGVYGSYDAQIVADAWDNYKYMNVYIQGDIYNNGGVTESGVAWYPSTSMSTAGTARVVYNGAYLGTNTDQEFASVLTHEFGHFLNLAHTFDNGCTSPTNDFVADTPPCDENYDATDICHPSSNANSPLNCSNQLINAENYMDYRGRSNKGWVFPDNGCYKMFTQGQIARMEAALQDPSRITLWQTSNLIATGLLNNMSANVIVSTATNPACSGSNVTFIAAPTNEGSAPVYQWKVNGVNTGTNSPTFSSSSLNSGDVISCVMTSNMPGALNNPATSNAVTINFNPVPTSSVSIALTTGTNPTCAGSSLTFTATPTNGGSSPIYQWKVNGVNVGTNFPTYTTTSITNGQVVTCEMISNLLCAPSTPVVSSGITMVISSGVSPSVAIAVTSGSNPSCANTDVTFNATPSNGGSAPFYQWKVNGSNIGTNSPTFTSSILANGDVVTCEMISNSSCATATAVTSNPIIMNISSLLPASVVIALTSGTNPTCSGSSVTFTAAATNGGSAPSYQWQVNGVNVGTNSQVFTTSALTNNQSVTCVLTSNSSCAFPSVVVSSGITMGISSSGSPSVSIALTSGSNPMCSGSSATFTATPTNGGASPVYQWQIDGLAVGNNVPTYTSFSLTNGQVITCIMTSNASCVSAFPVTSPGITISTSVMTTPTNSISIASGSNVICLGSVVTFTAAPANQGTSPSYQWKVDGAAVGSNSPTFTTNSLTNGQTVTCILTSSASCVSSPTAMSNTISMTVNTSVTPQISISTASGSTAFCLGTAVEFNANIQYGGTNPSFQWKVNGINQGTNSNVFTTSSLSNGQTVSCVLTSNESCASILSVTSTGITVNMSTSSTPTGASSQTFCNSGTVANLVASGSSIQWYNSSLGGSPLPNSTQLNNGATYYASQTVTGCESSGRLTVIVSITSTAAPAGLVNQSFCSAATVADLSAVGSSIQWFSSSSGGTSLVSSSPLINGNTYYASQSINGCVSISRLPVLVTINTTNAPNGMASQAVCPGSTIADLVVTGNQIQWYTGPTGGAVIATSSAILSGLTYYASQTISGCESNSRLGVTVSFLPAPVAPSGSSTQHFCETATIADLVATGSEIQWFSGPNSDVPLSNSTPLSNGLNYYASQTDGCESTFRLEVAVSITANPVVTLNSFPTVCDSDEPFILNQGSPFGGTYSGAGISEGIIDPSVAGEGIHTITYSYTDLYLCTGSTTGVLIIDDCVGLDEIEKQSFVIYPNPSSGNITILSSMESIKAVKVFDSMGRTIYDQFIPENGTEIKVDLTSYAGGIYTVQVATVGGVANTQILIEN